MEFKVEFLESANSDLFESLEFYSIISIDLARDFLIEIDKVKNLLVDNPFLFAIRHKGLRFAHIKKFRTLVIYLLEEAEHKVIIVSIVRTERNPKSYLK